MPSLPGGSQDTQANSPIETKQIINRYLMLRWVASGNLSYATAAERIIDAWSGTVQGFAGHDQVKRPFCREPAGRI